MNGRYLYAIVPGGNEKEYGDVGLLGSRVYALASGPVAVVVSDVENKKIRPERRNLAAHQAVIKQLSKETDLLPMSFGIIAESEKALEKILALNQEAFVEQLQRVQGKAEMGLRVNWDVPNIFEFLVGRYDEMREARDRLFAPHRNPSAEDKIEIGQMFERVLDEERENHTERVEEALSGCCVEIKRMKCRKEREVMNLACLIRRHEEQAFEAAVFEAAKGFDDHYSFDYTGPWAPHNFVDIQLSV